MVAVLPNSLRIRSKLLAAVANTFVPLPVYPDTDLTFDGSIADAPPDLEEDFFLVVLPNPPDELPNPPPKACAKKRLVEEGLQLK